MTELRQVQDGRISVNTLAEIIDHEDVKVYEIDLSTKYPVIYVSSEINDDGTHHVLHLAVGARTLRYDESKTGDTEFEFVAPPGEHWSIVVDGGRYEIRLVAYRHPRWEEE